MMKRFSAVVTGRVQGVGFRYFVRQVAEELGVTGYVRNARDGSVEVVAEGEDDALRILLQYLERGPSRAHVKNVALNWQQPDCTFDHFGVRA